MPQYFVKNHDIESGICRVTGSDLHHLVHVRRVKTGSLIDLRAENGAHIRARVSAISEDFITAEILEVKTPPGPALDLTLFMGLIKGPGMDLVVRKSTEAGISRLVPVICERSVVDPGEGASRKVERWRKIANEAAKQCMRESLPVVDEIITFSQALSSFSEGGLLAHPRGGAQLREIPVPAEGKGAVAVGPEGGFSDREAAAGAESGWRTVSFGANILKAETAGIVIPAIIIYEWSR